MNKIIGQTLFLLLIVGFIGCSSSQNTSTAQDKRHHGPDYSRFTSLADILRRQPGIQMTGTGDNVRIIIRGMNSMQLDTRPLFIVDNTIVGRDYSKVNEMINPIDVGSVRILKSYAETNSYGTQGRNGIIMIKTKKRNTTNQAAKNK